MSLYLRRLAVRGDKLIHIAFSDDSGDEARNMQVSQQLGTIVANALQERRVVPGDVVALGAALPLASDTTAVGRGINRRVETWIRP